MKLIKSLSFVGAAALFFFCTPTMPSAGAVELIRSSLPPVPPGGVAPNSYPEFEERVEECSDCGHYGTDLAIFSRYLWRGIQMSQGDPVAQLDIWAYYNGFKVLAWGNFDLSRSKFDQVNLIADYTTDFDSGYWFAGGIIHYIYRRQKIPCGCPKRKPGPCPKRHHSHESCHTCGCGTTTNTTNNTIVNAGNNLVPIPPIPSLSPEPQIYRRRKQDTELYLSYLPGGMFHPALTVYKDIAFIRGWSFTLSGMYCTDHLCFQNSFFLVNLQIAADISWRSHRYNRVYYCISRNGLADANLSISFPFCWKCNWTIAPTVKGCTLVKQSFREARPGNSAHIAYGITFSGAW